VDFPFLIRQQRKLDSKFSLERFELLRCISYAKAYQLNVFLKSGVFPDHTV
jgi:hypothetical protein